MSKLSVVGGGGGLLAQAVATTRLGDQVGDLRLGAGLLSTIVANPSLSFLLFFVDFVQDFLVQVIACDTSWLRYR